MAQEEQYQSIQFFKCDVDKASEVAGAASINCMPTLILFKGCQEVQRYEGGEEEHWRSALATLL